MDISVCESELSRSSRRPVVVPDRAMVDMGLTRKPREKSWISELIFPVDIRSVLRCQLPKGAKWENSPVCIH